MVRTKVRHYCRSISELSLREAFLLQVNTYLRQGAGVDTLLAIKDL